MASPDRFFCPVCFNRFESSDVDPAYPMCGDCGSEGMDFELVPVHDFLREASLDRLQEVQREWSRATGFLETYKRAKAARIEQMIQLKREYDSDHPLGYK